MVPGRGPCKTQPGKHPSLQACGGPSAQPRADSSVFVVGLFPTLSALPCSLSALWGSHRPKMQQGEWLQQGALEPDFLGVNTQLCGVHPALLTSLCLSLLA